MAAIYDDAKAAAISEADFVTACKQVIALHGLLTEMLYKSDGQALKWDGTNEKIPKNQTVLDAVYALSQVRDLLDQAKPNITRGANMIVTQVTGNTP